MTRHDGKSRREDDVIRVGATETTVSCVLESGTVVTRSRTRGQASRLTVERNGFSFDGAAQATIWEELGVGPDAFGEIVHVGQGRVTALADVGDRERRDVLLSWLGDVMDVWDRGRASVAKERSSARRLLDTRRAELAASEQLYTERVSELQSMGKSRDLESIERDLRDARALAAKAREQAETSARVARELAIAHADLAILERRPQEPEVDVPSVPDISREVGVAATTKARIRELRTVTGPQWTGACPITSGSCPARSHVDGHRTQTLATIQKLDAELADLDGVIDAGARVRAEARRAESANAAARGREQTRRTRIAALRDKIAEYETWIAPVSEPCESIATDIEELETEAAAARTRAHIEAEVERLEIRVRDAGTALLCAETEYRVLSEVVRACDQVSGPAVLAGTRIEDRVSDLLAGSGIQVQLSWMTTTRSRVSECQECGSITKTQRKTCQECGVERPMATVPDLGIIVSAGGTVRDIRHGSGGLRQLVCLALRLATCPTGHVVLDEADSALDRTSRAVASTMLRRAADAGTQILAVSHGEEFADSADRVFTVIPGIGADPASIEVST